MNRNRLRFFPAIVLPAALLSSLSAGAAAARKEHSVYLGAVRHVPYSQQGDPAGAATGEDSLAIRALVVNGERKEWTTGDSHDVTDRSFVVRRAMRLNNSLPGDKQQEWVWQRGPWLMVDRETGRVTALKLPDYDPAVSRVAWFRDYGAYCGVTPSGKSLYAVVAQLTVRRPALAKKLSTFDPAEKSGPACAPAEWQRDPMRITFRPTGHDAVTYDFTAGSAVLVEDAGDEPATRSEAPADGADAQSQQ